MRSAGSARAAAARARVRAATPRPRRRSAARPRPRCRPRRGDDASGTSAALSIRPSRKSEKATAPRLARGRRQRRTTATGAARRSGRAARPAHRGRAARRGERDHGRPTLAAEEPLPAPRLEAVGGEEDEAGQHDEPDVRVMDGQPWIRKCRTTSPPTQREGDGEDVEKGLQPHKGTNRQPRRLPEARYSTYSSSNPSAAGARADRRAPDVSGIPPRGRAAPPACRPRRALDVVRDRVATITASPAPPPAGRAWRGRSCGAACLAVGVRRQHGVGRRAVVRDELVQVARRVREQARSSVRGRAACRARAARRRRARSAPTATTAAPSRPQRRTCRRAAHADDDRSVKTPNLLVVVELGVLLHLRERGGAGLVVRRGSRSSP